MSRYTSNHTGSEIDAAIDRAKAGGEIDTLLSGKAPAGFGFGEVPISITADGKSETWETYCARIDAIAGTMPIRTPKLVYITPPYFFGWSPAPAILTKHDAAGNVITVRTLSSYDGSYSGIVDCFSIQIKKTNGVWEPLEWTNPPMLYGVEYRTTEKFNGKPVYVKLVDFGALPNTSSKYVDPNISNFEKLIEPLTVTIYRSDTSVHGTPMVEDTSTYARSWFKMTVGGIVIRTMVNLSADSAIVKLKYTKTTN